MALHVASLLDQTVLREEWSTQTRDVLNGALAEIPVASGYRVMVTIANRTYLLSSDANGRLQISQLPDGLPTTKALATAQVRIVIEANAFEGSMDEEQARLFMAKRHFRVEGDSSKVFDMQDELAPYLSSLRSKVEAHVPGKRAMDEAVATHNAQVLDNKAWEEQNFLQLLSYTQDTEAMEIVEYQSDVLLQQFQGYLMFSASSSMFGNIGQANYVAAGMAMEALTFSSRQSRPSFEAISHMWGAVGGLGMRWKAFGSQDALLQEEESAKMMISFSEALYMLRIMFSGTYPEWASGFKPGPGFLEWTNALHRHEKPWGYSKGRGGGSSIQSPPAVSEGAKDRQDNSHESMRDDLGLFPGCRIRICGLVAAADLNGTKATLVEEVGLSKWQVRLDDGLGDKLLKVQNMERLHAKGVVHKVISLADLEFCLAGVWNDWTPQDMRWKPKQKCFSLKANVRAGLQGRGFGICRGKAGTRWKTQKQEWTLGTDGQYEIRLFVKESGSIKKVDWVRLAEASPLLP